MVNDIVEGILQLKMFVLVSAVSILLFAVIMLIYCRRFQWTGKNIKLMGFFYELGMKETLALAVASMKILFVVSIIFMGCRVEKIHIIFYLMLVIISVAFSLGRKAFLLDFANGMVTIAVFLVMRLLRGYLDDVYFDKRVALAMALLVVFLLLYTVSDLFRSAGVIIHYHNSKIKDSIVS